MKINIGNSKARSLLSKNFNLKDIDKALIRDFKNWLEKQAKELNKEERRGELLDEWLSDIGKYYLISRSKRG